MQLRLRTIFLFTTIVAVLCAVGPPAWRWFRPRPYITDLGHWKGGGLGWSRAVNWSDGTTTVEYDSSPLVIEYVEPEDR